MVRLLTADFMRMTKSRMLWICMIFMAGLAVVMVADGYMAKKDGLEIALEGNVIAFVIFAGITGACFTSIFTGTEYSDGTIRNKIVTGRPRTAVYLSAFASSSVAGLFMCFIYLAVYLAAGIPAFGWFQCKLQTVIVYVICAFVVSVVLSSVFTLIAMISRSRAMTAVISILMAFLILFTGLHIGNRLNEPEYYDGYMYMTEEGVMQDVSQTKNPSYLDGTKREVYEFFYDFLPGGQQMQLAQNAAAHPWRLIGYSCVIMTAVTAAGIFIFRRKDLK